MLNYLHAALHTPAPTNERFVFRKPDPATLIGVTDDGWIEKPALPAVGEIVDGESFAGEPRRGIYMDHRNGWWFAKNNTFAGCIARWRKRDGEMVVNCTFTN